MSFFISTNGSTLGLAGNFALVPNDERAGMFWWYTKSFWNIRPDALWPGTRCWGSEGLVATSPMITDAAIWDWGSFLASDPGAGQRRNTVSGITRGPGGPLAGVTVEHYRTLTDEVVDKTTSAADGSYTVTSPYGSEATYARGHITGSPDLDGVTAQTLTPI